MKNAGRMRGLERAGGVVLIIGGLAWLVLGLRSILGEDFSLRGALIVVVIAIVLMISGAMLAKPRDSTAGRILAVIVCILGAFRELMLLDHQTVATLKGGDLTGIVLLSIYALIAAIVMTNFIMKKGR